MSSPNNCRFALEARIGIRPDAGHEWAGRVAAGEVLGQGRYGALAIRHECARRQSAGPDPGFDRCKGALDRLRRPAGTRREGHLLTEHLLEVRTEGSFAKDPPNATVSVLSKDGASVRDAVVELRDPHLDGDRLTFDVRVLEGDLAGADGFTPLSYADVARHTARRAYRYGAAAAAAPYYPLYGTRRRLIIPIPTLLHTEILNIQ
jgi:hypothetical protein